MGKMEQPVFELGKEPSPEERERLIEKAMLDTVLKTAGNEESRVREGIIAALSGVNDKARRTYLWNQLERKALRKIRGA